ATRRPPSAQRMTSPTPPTRPSRSPSPAEPYAEGCAPGPRPGAHPPLGASAADLLRLPGRPQPLLVHRRDRRQRDALGAGGGALAGEGAAAEALRVHLPDHVEHPGLPL